jgi:hypothetical protein
MRGREGGKGTKVQKIKEIKREIIGRTNERNGEKGGKEIKEKKKGGENDNKMDKLKEYGRNATEYKGTKRIQERKKESVPGTKIRLKSFPLNFKRCVVPCYEWCRDIQKLKMFLGHLRCPH